MLFVRKEVCDNGRTNDGADNDVQSCGEGGERRDKIKKASCGDRNSDEQQNVHVVAGRGDDDRHKHGVEGNAESAHEHIVVGLICAVGKRRGKQFADSCSESGSAQPTAEGTGHQSDQVRECQLLRLSYRDGKILIRNAESDEGSLPKREAASHFLGKGERHESVADIDDKHSGNEDGDSGACGDEIGAGELTGSRKIRGRDQNGKPGRESLSDSLDGISESDGDISQSDGQAVFKSAGEFHGRTPVKDKVYYNTMQDKSKSFSAEFFWFRAHTY